MTSVKTQIENANNRSENMMMARVLMVSREKNIFSEIKTGFEKNNISSDQVATAEQAFSKIAKEAFDLVIIEEQLPDMSGRQFVEKLVMTNPMLNCVVASDLSHEAFHDAYEGYGVLMQFPMSPGEKDFQSLMTHLNTIARIAGQAGQSKGD